MDQTTKTEQAYALFMQRVLSPDTGEGASHWARVEAWLDIVEAITTRLPN